MKKPANRPENAKPKVAWYDPCQLMKTGMEVMVSTVIGRHSDHRIIEAVIAPKGAPFRDYTYFHHVGEDYKDSEKDSERGERDEIWVDYVADTGDGWNATYAVAYAIAHPERCVNSLGELAPGQRGTLLIMGGDQVYPTASRKDYKDRLITPYEAALKRTDDEHPQVLAIPGNHDWYDSLVSFTRVFIGKEWLAGWFAPQDRSYFACKLPQGWWLLGIDTQLGADLDGPQVEYFESVANAMGPDDRVVLCCAEPQWILEKLYSSYDKEVYNESNLHYLNKKVLHGRVRAYVAGDLHHYRRHANGFGVQKITCGGGGAFLHPTHAPKARVLASDGAITMPKGRRRVAAKEEYEQRAAYPDEATSRWITRRNLLFPFLNPWFGVLVACLYFITAWMFMLPTGRSEALCGSDYFSGVLTNLIDRPAASFWALLVVASVAFFTDTHSPIYRRVAGTLHGLSHLLTIILLGWAATMLVRCYAGNLDLALQFLIKAAVILLGGWFLGSMIMGIYLLISLNVFGRHYNEAFSSLGVEDYKCFMRFHVDTQGDLTIHPMGIKRVPTKWKDEGEHAVPRWEPLNGKLIVDPIEAPIRVTKGLSQSASNKI